jgi:hypothetical protein
MRVTGACRASLKSSGRPAVTTRSVNSTKAAATNAARRAIERYELALGIDPRFRSVLLVISRVEIAVRRNQQQHDDGTATADVREGNATLGYLSRLAELRTALFPAAESADRV